MLREAAIALVLVLAGPSPWRLLPPSVARKGGGASADTVAQGAGRPSPSTMTLAELAAEYRRLRAISVREPKTPQEEDDVFCWGGRMQSVMEELGRRLGVSGKPAVRVTAMMGKPDGVSRSPDDAETRMYLSRRRDELRFVVKDGVVMSSSWWYPYE